MFQAHCEPAAKLANVQANNVSSPESGNQSVDVPHLVYDLLVGRFRKTQDRQVPQNLRAPVEMALHGPKNERIDDICCRSFVSKELNICCVNGAS